MRKLLFYFVFLLLCVCCKNNQNIPTIETLNEPIDIKLINKFNIEEQQLNWGYAYTSDFFENDSLQLLIGLNSYFKNLDLIDLKEEKVFKVIDLSGDQFRIHNFDFQDFYIQSLDSIFLYSPDNFKIALINHTGQISNIFNLGAASNQYQSNDFFQISSVSRRNIIYNNIKNEFIIRTIPPFNWYTDSEFYTKPFLSVFDIDRNQFKNTFGLYPKEFYDNQKYSTFDYQHAYFIDLKSNKYITSFRTDHNLYEFELYTNKLHRKISAKSNYLDQFQFSSKKFDLQMVSNNLIQIGNYNNLIYNQRTKEFYRIVVHNQDLVNQKSGLNNHPINNRDFSIIFLNENLEVKGEKLFENANFNFLGITAVSGGILMAYRDKTNENIIHFETYTTYY